MLVSVSCCEEATILGWKIDRIKVISTVAYSTRVALSEEVSEDEFECHGLKATGFKRET